MSLQSGAAILALGLGLWCVWSQLPPRTTWYGNQDHIASIIFEIRPARRTGIEEVALLSSWNFLGDCSVQSLRCRAKK
ncbi:hypothetical protein BJ742DRAFT_804400 [Cladochytrium replicatum]|nr:hypothetical protein BJ742DRAFT_804400 [Cladochytrium replicatum]